MKATASAPGKILWLGGYSVLEKGKLAYVTSVGPRCYATVEPAATEPVVISAPQLNSTTEYWLHDGKLKHASHTPEAAVQSTKFVGNAASAAMSYLAAKGYKLHAGLRIETRSDGAFASGAGKSGLGASAAMTVATVAAVIGAHEVVVEETTIHNIAQYAHSAAQGKIGSGFDVAAAAFGSCIYSRYSPETIEKATPADFDRKWNYTVEKLELPKILVPAFANIAGESTSTTEMVRKVKAWQAANDGDYRTIIARLDSVNRKAIETLKKIADNQPLFEEFKRHFGESRAITRELGELAGAQIEPLALGRALDASEANGALCAKLPGAGGGDAIAAICMGAANKEKLTGFWRQYTGKKLEPIEVGGTKGGVRLEPATQAGLKTQGR
jgi:phosphomevalonate kinase